MWTTHVLVRPALLLVCLFCLTAGLIRTQPYDNGELRVFLTPPDGCPMPCFMGIRPGVTTPNHVMLILENHPWVGEMEVHRSGRPRSWYESGSITWEWSGAQPDLIDSTEPGFVSLYRNQASNLTDGGPRVVVDTVVIRTTIAFHDLYLTLGPPDTSAASRLVFPEMMYTANYLYDNPPATIVVFTRLTCPIHLTSYLNAKADLLVSANMSRPNHVSPYELSTLCKQ